MFLNNFRARFRQWVERHVIADDPNPERSRLDIMCEGAAAGTAPVPPGAGQPGVHEPAIDDGQAGD